MMLDWNKYAEVAQFLEGIDKKWAFYILVTLLIYNALAFNGIKKKVKPVSSRTLSKRLKQLVDIGLISREVLVEFPKRVEYKLTEEGEKFLSFILEFFEGKASN